MSTSGIRVLCVDDNDLVVEAVYAKLSLVGGFHWLGHMDRADTLAEQIERLCPDVVLLDLDMPGRDPFEALEEVTERCPNARVLIFSGHIQGDLVDRAVEAGAWGFLSKHEDVETIVSTIRRVARGEFVLDEGAATSIGSA